MKYYTINTFLEDRKKMLLSGKYEDYVKFCEKYKMVYTIDKNIFEIALHKSRANCTDLPIEVVQESRLWLLNNGYRIDLGDNNE